MIPKSWFLRWTLFFSFLGLLVPAVITIGFYTFGARFGGFPLWLWPSSLMFMALDVPKPAPMSTVVFIYSMAFAENSLLYSAVGIMTSPIVYLVRKRYAANRSGFDASSALK